MIKLITRLLSYVFKDLISDELLGWVGLVVSVSASHAVGRGFAPQPGHIKDHRNKSNTECSSIRPTYIFSA